MTMHPIRFIAVLVIASPLPAVGQSSKGEQQVRRFLAEYDKAIASRDIVFLEAVLPSDYTYTGASGKESDRARVLAFFTREKDTPTYTMNSLKHEDVQVRVVGNMAVVTNDYTSQTTPIDSPEAEPDIDKGRHTGVFERRNGRWMVIAEQDTEQPHDDRLMERQVVKAGREYNDLMKRLQSGGSLAEFEKGGDIAVLKRRHAEEYTGTSPDGDICSKAEEVEGYQSNQMKVESAELSQQRVRAIDNNTAVETGRIRYLGTRAGRPVDITKRFTRTWVFRERWQVLADHDSLVRKKD